MSVTLVTGPFQVQSWIVSGHKKIIIMSQIYMQISIYFEQQYQSYSLAFMGEEYPIAQIVILSQ